MRLFFLAMWVLVLVFVIVLGFLDGDMAKIGIGVSAIGSFWIGFLFGLDR